MAAPYWDDAGNHYYTRHYVNDHTIEKLEELEYDLRQEKLEHYEGRWDSDVDHNLSAAKIAVNAALRALREYVEQCKEEDKDE